jgi:hypothetical protein
MWTATLSAAISRCRGERVVLNIADPETTSAGASSRLAQRAVTALSQRVVHLPAVDRSGTDPVWTVLAVCGDDVAFAHTMVSTMNSMSDSVAHRWRLRLNVSPTAIHAFANGVRPDRAVSVEVDSPSSAAIAGAEVVIVAHGSAEAGKVDEAVASGGAGVIVGHPVAGRVARRADGVWLAATDPAAVVVAMESATGAISGAPVSVEALRRAGDRVLAQVDALV